MQTKDSRATLKISQDLYSRLKRMQYNEWETTRREPTYTELIERALDRQPAPAVPERITGVLREVVALLESVKSHEQQPEPEKAKAKAARSGAS